MGDFPLTIIYLHIIYSGGISMKPIKTIKNGWNKFTVVVKDKDYSTREAVLFAICTFLTGLVLGMLCSPRKNQTFGSYNGNCSDGGCNCDCDYDEDDFE